REATIEAALERVRSRSMAMHKSEELKEIIQVVYEQFLHLNILVEHAGFIMDYKERDDMHIWLADQYNIPSQITIPYFDSPHWNSFIEAKEKGLDFFANHLGFEEKNKFYQGLFKLFPGVADEAKDYYFNSPGLAISTVLLENIGLYIENFSAIPYTDEENATLMRFGKVFQQTYTRFLDLQKAEAQAREAKIEAALEKVRSRTMGMQLSEELGDVATVLFKELNQLVENLWTCGFVLCERERPEDEWWLSTETGFIPAFYLPNTSGVTHANIYQGWLNGESYHTEQLEGEALKEHYEWLMNIPVSRKIFEEMMADGFTLPTWRKLHCAYFSQGYLVIITQVPCPEELIFKRFAQVFDLTYTRFLDLQKAELQAREAKIEVALEKIRSRSLGMHRSVEIKDVVSILFEKLKELDLAFDGGAAIHLFTEGSRHAVIWVASPDLAEPTCVNLPYDENAFESNPIITDVWNAKETGEDIYNKFYSLEEKNTYFDYVFKHNDLITVPKLSRDFILQADSYTASFIAEKNSLLGANSWTRQLFSDNDFIVLKRIARVFEQAYIRFLDLQKAEAQSRESQIEAALERVRSRTLAMQKSDELAETAAVLFKQLINLGIAPNRLYIGIVRDDDGHIEFWVT
ncbi:MAG: hypothetical protein H7122_00710, partial [Chitinophagaceae bacterium]|nr:hypothetical protein [Chitinophagaceae bacterium]